MLLQKDSLDDLLREVLKKLLTAKTYSASRGDFTEIDGVVLKLRNPLARLSRTDQRGNVFSCLGEFLWYLSGKDDLDFIEYYLSRYADESKDGVSVYGGYGPRLFSQRSIDQLANVISLLRDRPSSRRAVLQLFNAEDIQSDQPSIPCTCNLQFLIRNKQLNMYTYMRSNDAYWGLPHDIFAFTMLQEIVARTLGYGLGQYVHMVASLHLYKEKFEDSEVFLNEGFQEEIPMPLMPSEDPWHAIEEVLRAESVIRSGTDVDADSFDIDKYWKDIVRLLLIFRAFKENELRSVVRHKREMASPMYEIYIRKKEERGTKPPQMDILDEADQP